ncbi:hypothetical protein HDV00_006087 [Rhizophlyctis rosea]|nr:hypothetical protein HDV00_006087 [Rhizophlyctis rosea]
MDTEVNWDEAFPTLTPALISGSTPTLDEVFPTSTAALISSYTPALDEVFPTTTSAFVTESIPAFNEAFPTTTSTLVTESIPAFNDAFPTPTPIIDTSQSTTILAPIDTPAPVNGISVVDDLVSGGEAAVAGELLANGSQSDDIRALAETIAQADAEPIVNAILDSIAEASAGAGEEGVEGGGGDGVVLEEGRQIANGELYWCYNISGEKIGKEGGVVDDSCEKVGIHHDTSNPPAAPLTLSPTPASAPARAPPETLPPTTAAAPTPEQQHTTTEPEMLTPSAEEEETVFERGEPEREMYPQTTVSPKNDVTLSPARVEDVEEEVVGGGIGVGEDSGVTAEEEEEEAREEGRSPFGEELDVGEGEGGGVEAESDALPFVQGDTEVGQGDGMEVDGAVMEGGVGVEVGDGTTQPDELSSSLNVAEDAEGVVEMEMEMEVGEEGMGDVGDGTNGGDDEAVRVGTPSGAWNGDGDGDGDGDGGVDGEFGGFAGYAQPPHFPTTISPSTLLPLPPTTTPSLKRPRPSTSPSPTPPPKRPSTTPSLSSSTPSASRRTTRVRTPVNYKALLDGPSVKKQLVRPKKEKYDEKGRRVYCFCRGVDDGKFMIGCDGCREWFHGSCVGITKKVGEKMKSYTCRECLEWEGGGSEATGVASPSVASPSGEVSGGSASPATPGGGRGRRRESHSTSTHNLRRRSDAGVAVTNGGGEEVEEEEDEQGFDDVEDSGSEAGPGVSSSEDEEDSENYDEDDSDDFYEGPALDDDGTTRKKRKREGVCRRRGCEGFVDPDLNGVGGVCSEECGRVLRERREKRKGGEGKKGRGVERGKRVKGKEGKGKVEEEQKKKEEEWQQDPFRRNARLQFTQTFTELFTSFTSSPETFGPTLVLSPTIDLRRPDLFAASLENALYEALAEEDEGKGKKRSGSAGGNGGGGGKRVGEKYKARYRSLQWNLRRLENVRLKRRVLSGGVGVGDLVGCAVSELGGAGVEDEAVPVGGGVEGTESSGGGGKVEETKEDVGREGSGKEGGEGRGESDFDAVMRKVREREMGKRKVVEGEGGGGGGKRVTVEEFAGVEDGGGRGMVVEEKKEEEEEESGGGSGEKKESESSGGDVKVDPSTATAADDGEEIREEFDFEGDPSGDVVVPENLVPHHHHHRHTPSTKTSPPSTDDHKPVWKGRINMPGVTRVSCSALPLSSSKIEWGDYIPTTLEIAGRLPFDAVETYVSQQRRQGKTILCCEFLPSGDSDGNKVERSYRVLWDYFMGKGRCGVVKQVYASVKDFYVVPVRGGEGVKACFSGGEDGGKGRKMVRDGFLGVLVLGRGWGGGGGGGRREREEKGGTPTVGTPVTPVTSTGEQGSVRPPPPPSQPQMMPQGLATLGLAPLPFAGGAAAGAGGGVPPLTGVPDIRALTALLGTLHQQGAQGPPTTGLGVLGLPGLGGAAGSGAVGGSPPGVSAALPGLGPAAAGLPIPPTTTPFAGVPVPTTTGFVGVPPQGGAYPYAAWPPFVPPPAQPQQQQQAFGGGGVTSTWEAPKVNGGGQAQPAVPMMHPDRLQQLQRGGGGGGSGSGSGSGGQGGQGRPRKSRWDS